MLLFFGLALTGCSHPHSEMYAWGDDWYSLDPQTGDRFFAALQAKLASEGMKLSGPPADSFAASAGVQPNPGDQLLWYHGSYQGSHEFRIKLLRSGAHLECFHLMYEWDIATTSPTNEEMEAATRRLHESLKDWVAKGGLAHLPPRTP